MPIAQKIQNFMHRSSWIRAMFEAGIKLKSEVGPKNVYDFSLGNPILEPPIIFKKIIKKLINNTATGQHAYMPNAGYPIVRAKIAQYLTKLHNIFFNEEEIVMTTGAAGALNIVLKAIINPGSNIVIPKPYFPEYEFYIDNHGGNLIEVTTKNNFTLDIAAIAEGINDKTCAVLINNPNNPSGAVYPEEQIIKLGKMLMDMSYQQSRIIYLICDEPYREIVYDNTKVPSVITAYSHSIIVTSFSKNLSLPGERIGYVAVNPQHNDKKELIAAITFANRILGYVNAPALMQRAIAALLKHNTDINKYAKKRDLICDILSATGYTFYKPLGAFYVFPKSPINDDITFVHEAQKENLLLVPGSGFMSPGYFRIAFCCSDETIINSKNAFKRVRSKFLL